MKHEITRIRHDLRQRQLTVTGVEHITPGMLRIRLAGADLAGFTSLAPDDHVKILIPGADGGLERRDYTPRQYDAAKGELAIDFALHEAGPATAWALGARPGDGLTVAGPRGSQVVPADFDWWLLIGDETALPAIGRRVEELPAGVPVTSLVAVADAAEEQRFATRADHRALWVHRPLARADDPAPLLSALQELTLPPGEGFVWIAAEAGVARALRRQVVEAMGHPPAWLRAAGYWVHGRADAHEKFEN
ncbi:MAG: siderophore-interacting protein [Azospirillaceae bacterium]|nr:siderophore-interacting protein [Azospirillaceae bacterium]